VSEDIGQYWKGIGTVVHELAHNLGSHHDGDGESKTCSWEDGHIMSYEGRGTLDKFKFSTCSIESIKKFLESEEGSCLTM